MKENRFEIGNVDSTVHLEKPKLRPFIEPIRESLAVALETDTKLISIKAKTGEGVDAVGEMRAVKVDAVVLLKPVDPSA